LLIERLLALFRFVELEDDAVFVFAPAVAVEDAEPLLDIVKACYAARRLSAIRRLLGRLAWGWRVMPYGIGSVAMFWVIQRVLLFQK
jgi:hypothetical protein